MSAPSEVGRCRVCGLERKVNKTREVPQGRGSLCRACSRTPSVSDTSWMDRAACIGADLDIFFDDERIRTGEYQQFCSTCPVRAECLKYAERSRERHGVFGGLTAVQRGTARRKTTAPSKKPGKPLGEYETAYAERFNFDLVNRRQIKRRRNR